MNQLRNWQNIKSSIKVQKSTSHSKMIQSLFDQITMWQFNQNSVKCEESKSILHIFSTIRQTLVWILTNTIEQRSKILIRVYLLLFWLKTFDWEDFYRNEQCLGISSRNYVNLSRKRLFTKHFKDLRFWNLTLVSKFSLDLTVSQPI